jgi:peroxiredoxin
MSIKIGDTLPEGTLMEYIEVEGEGCSVGPNAFKVSDLTAGKKVIFFGLPGAFTPGCSNFHLPGFVKHFDDFKARGVDAIYCLSVNDAFVMGAWARDQKTAGKVRLLADGSGAFTKQLGLELDLTTKGMGIRSQRYAMLVDKGVVKQLNIDASGKIEASGAETLLKQLS